MSIGQSILDEVGKYKRPPGLHYLKTGKLTPEQEGFALRVDEFMDEVPLWSRKPKPTLTFRGNKAVLEGEIDDEKLSDEMEGYLDEVPKRHLQRKVKSTMHALVFGEIEDGARKQKLKVKKIDFGGSFRPEEPQTRMDPGAPAAFEDMGIKVTFDMR